MTLEDKSPEIGDRIICTVGLHQPYTVRVIEPSGWIHCSNSGGWRWFKIEGEVRRLWRYLDNPAPLV